MMPFWGGLTGLALAAATVTPHDFWLAAGPWRTAPGSKVTLTANLGDRFPRSTAVIDPERVDSLQLVGPSERRALTLSFWRIGDSLAADFDLPTEPSTYIAVMVVKPELIETNGPEFETHLRREGLERIIEERRTRLETSRPGRELSSRYAKVLIRAGEGDSTHVCRPTDQRAELVPLQDPTALRVGDTLGLRFLFDGRPLTDALVGGIYAISLGRTDEWPLKARTDANGEVRFRLEHHGPWLFRSVHMVRRQTSSDEGPSEWESFWVSLTFESVVAHTDGQTDVGHSVDRAARPAVPAPSKVGCQP